MQAMFLSAIMMFAAAAHGSARPLDACHVLTKGEIASVQGAAYTETKLTTHENTTTCFYQLPLFTDSVSLDVTPTGAREFWEQHFEQERESTREEEEEHRSPPLKVVGVGDEALWIGGRASGSLYVRKGDAMLRVSVGGKGKDKEKIVRSKRLAIKALRRI